MVSMIERNISEDPISNVRSIWPKFFRARVSAFPKNASMMRNVYES